MDSYFTSESRRDSRTLLKSDQTYLKSSRNQNYGFDETEDLKVDRKTKQLFAEWQKIEQRADELRYYYQAFAQSNFFKL